MFEHRTLELSSRSVNFIRGTSEKRAPRMKPGYRPRTETLIGSNSNIHSLQADASYFICFTRRKGRDANCRPQQTSYGNQRNLWKNHCVTEHMQKQSRRSLKCSEVGVVALVDRCGSYWPWLAWHFRKNMNRCHSIHRTQPKKICFMSNLLRTMLMARLEVEGFSQYVWQFFLQRGHWQQNWENTEYRLLKLLTGAVRWCITERFWPTRAKKKEIRMTEVLHRSVEVLTVHTFQSRF